MDYLKTKYGERLRCVVAAGAAVDMLAHMLDGALDAAGRLAEYAYQARVAGLVCERIYDSMRQSD